MLKIGYRPQRSLAQAVEVHGVGLITGARLGVRFLPASADTGLVFSRTDLVRREPILARAGFVTGTQRRTTLGTAPNQVTLVEHVLAALSGMRIDNCVVELDGLEPPGLDGSALAFVEALVEGGIVLQTVRRSIWTVSEPVVLRQDGATLSFHPGAGEELRISYLLDYGPLAPIAPQAHTETITPERFHHELADCRTFVLEAEARDMQARGIGRHLGAADLIVFGQRGPIGNELRRPDEPARHKILDLVGDLALCGMDLAGHIVAYRSGHPLNVEMAKTLCRLAKSECGKPARKAAA